MQINSLIGNEYSPPYCYNWQVCSNLVHMSLLVIVLALNWNKLVNWNNLKESTPFQLEAITVFKNKKKKLL